MSGIQIENWRAIPGYEGRYEASDLGRIRSLLHPTPLTLKLMSLGPGYNRVGLSREGKAKGFKVATLVLLTFVGPMPPDKQVCAHWDGDHTNDKLSNLRWATQLENMADARRHGRTLTGERNTNAILSNADVLQIRRQLYSGERACDLAKAYGVSAATLCDIARHRTYRDLPNSPGPVRFKEARKLTDDQVVQMRQLYRQGWQRRRLAEQFGVRRSCVGDIVTGKRRLKAGGV